MPSGRVKKEYDAMDVDSDDPVVREIDVFVAPEVSQELYLLQYPLQTSAIDTPTEARIKTQCGLIELEYPVPTNIQRHDDFSHIKSRTYKSQTIPIETHMCVGKLNKEANGAMTMHLVPLYHINQMRPDFDHAARNQDDVQDLMSEDDEEDEEVAEIKPVVYRRKETDRAILARKQSYAYKLEKEAAEEWQHLEVYDSTEARFDYQTHLLCPRSHHHPLSIKETGDQYVNSLRYDTQEVEEVGKVYIPSRELVRELTTLMSPGQPIPFSLIRAKAKAVDDATLSHCLSVCAVRVCGVFCLNSKFMKMSRMLQEARTFLLLLLERKGVVYRKCLSDVDFDGEKVSDEHWLVLLQQVGKKADRSWEMKIESSDRLPPPFESLSKTSKAYWDRQEHKFRKELKEYQSVIDEI